MDQPVFLLLGSNLHEGSKTPADLMAAARSELKTSGTIGRSSALYRTAPWGFADQPDFLNQVVMLNTGMAPAALLEQLLLIEKNMGRIRLQKNGPRVIDIDILLYGNEIIRTPDLTVPHPRLAERKFALAPLAELAPELVHPVLKRTIRQLLDDCPDPLDVHKID